MERLGRSRVILELNKQELTVSSEERARLVAIIVSSKLLFVKSLHNVVNKDGRLRHDTSSCLGGWEISSVTNRKDI